jgi:hypothetical protein
MDHLNQVQKLRYCYFKIIIIIIISGATAQIRPWPPLRVSCDK